MNICRVPYLTDKGGLELLTYRITDLSVGFTRSFTIIEIVSTLTDKLHTNKNAAFVCWSE